MSEQIAYAAGIYDGEGSMATYIGSGPNRTGLVFTASIEMKGLNALEFMQDLFGGGLYNRKQKGMHEWRATGVCAYNFFTAIRPYLIVRASDVDIMMHIFEIRLDRKELVKYIAARKKDLDIRHNRTH